MKIMAFLAIFMTSLTLAGEPTYLDGPLIKTPLPASSRDLPSGILLFATSLMIFMAAYSAGKTPIDEKKDDSDGSN